MNYLNNVNLGFERHIREGIVYYTVPSLDKYVDFAFCGDISNQLTFKDIRGADTEEMRKSFEKLCSVLSMPYEACVMTNIVHEDNIIEIDDTHKGYGVSSDIKLPSCDGLITACENIPIASTHADCMPIAIYDKKQNIGCVIHAGWRGILAQIQNKALKIFCGKYGSSPCDLLIAVGPTIKQCCFEVDYDVTDLFKQVYSNIDFVQHCGEKDKLDLLKLVLLTFDSFDIPPSNVTVDNRCTACKGSGLESYRRDKNLAKTMVQIMKLKY